MMKKLFCIVAISAAVANSAWANSFSLGLVDPVASQTAIYPEGPGQALLEDSFSFSIANGDWVTVDFQGMPSPGTGYSAIDFNFNFGSKVWGSWNTPDFQTTYFATKTLTGLTAGTEYLLNVYGWGDPMSSATGAYSITLTTASGVAPVPEPETYAMMLAGLGLLGVVARRRKQKSAA
jgi:hypothetical protein